MKHVLHGILGIMMLAVEKLVVGKGVIFFPLFLLDP